MQINGSLLSPTMLAVVSQAVGSGWTSDTLATPQEPQTSPSNQTTAGTASENSVTGTGVGGGLLASDTARYLMQLDQEMSDPTATGSDGKSGTASTSEQATDTADMAFGDMDIMQNVATNPASATTWAQHLASATILVAGRASDLLAPDSAARLKAAQSTVNAVQQQMNTLYKTDTAEGKSGAQTVADLLQFQLSQPQSYWDAYDPDHLEANAKAATQTQLDILQQTAAANGAPLTISAAQSPATADASPSGRSGSSTPSASDGTSGSSAAEDFAAAVQNYSQNGTLYKSAILAKFTPLISTPTDTSA